MFSDINCSSIFFNSSPTVIKIKINKWDLIKFKSLWEAKETINKTKGQYEEQEKIFANGEVNNELVTKICKEHMWLNTIKTHNPIKKWAEDTNRHFSKEVIQMAERHIKRCSTLLIIQEMQVKTTMRSHLTPVRTATIEISARNKQQRGCGKKGTLLPIGGNINWQSHYE